MIGIFDRSHYEDVLVVRVNELVDSRSGQALRRDQRLGGRSWSTRGTVLIKCFLHVSADEQKARLLARLDDPTKYWKYNPGDVDERAKWPAYTEAYQAVLERCNTERAPWYVVPADRKWYRNWAVAQLLVEHLRALDLLADRRLRRRGEVTAHRELVGTITARARARRSAQGSRADDRQVADRGGLVLGRPRAGRRSTSSIAATT